MECGYLDSEKNETAKNQELRSLNVRNDKKRAQELIEEEDNAEEDEKKIQQLFAAQRMEKSLSLGNPLKESIIQKLLAKLDKTATELEASSSIELSLKLTTLMKELVETIKSIEQL